LIIEQAMVGFSPLGHHNCRDIEGKNGQEHNYAHGNEEVSQPQLALTTVQGFGPVQAGAVHLKKRAKLLTCLQ